MSLPHFPKTEEYRNDSVGFIHAVLKWKLKHLKVDAYQEKLFLKVLNENTELKNGIREFFEWLESSIGTQSNFNLYPTLDKKEYEEKKKSLGLGK